MKNKIKALFGVVLSLVLIYFVFRNSELKIIYDYLKNISPGYIVSGILVFILGYVFKAHRWLLILKPSDKKFNFQNTYPPFFIGFAVNNILPLRLGEVVRGVLFSKNTNSSISFSFSSIFLDRVLDGFTLVILLAGAILLMPVEDWTKRLLIISGAVFLTGLLISYLLVRNKNFKFSGIIKHNSPVIKRIDLEIVNIRDSFEILRNLRQFLLVLLFSLVVWILEAFMYYLFAKGMQINITFIESMLVMTVINFGILLPSSPAYIGTFEFFCIKSLSLFGIGQELSIAYAVLLHAGQFMALTLLGIISINYLGLNWKKIKIMAISPKKARI